MFGLSSINTERGYWSGTDAARVVTGITVGAGNNTQALAVPLAGEVNVISTNSATAATGVRLPAGAAAGDTVVVFNAGANAVAVYPATGGKVNALATNAAYSMATGTRAMFVAVSSTDWVALLSA